MNLAYPRPAGWRVTPLLALLLVLGGCQPYPRMPNWSADPFLSTFGEDEAALAGMRDAEADLAGGRQRILVQDMPGLNGAGPELSDAQRRLLARLQGRVWWTRSTAQAWHPRYVQILLDRYGIDVISRGSAHTAALDAYVEAYNFVAEAALRKRHGRSIFEDARREAIGQTSFTAPTR